MCEGDELISVEDSVVLDGLPVVVRDEPDKDGLELVDGVVVEGDLGAMKPLADGRGEQLLLVREQ